MGRGKGAAATLALVAGAICGVALVLNAADRRTELMNGIDGSLAVSSHCTHTSRVCQTTGEEDAATDNGSLVLSLLQNLWICLPVPIQYIAPKYNRRKQL